jgi:hypothetical protein
MGSALCHFKRGVGQRAWSWENGEGRPEKGERERERKGEVERIIDRKPKNGRGRERAMERS